MFQYAFGLASAKKLKTAVRFTTTNDYSNELDIYFDIPKNRIYGQPTSYQNWIFNKMRRLKCVKTYSEDVVGEDFHLKNYTAYEGYFQNENYFLNIAENLNKIYSIRSSWVEQFDRIKYGLDLDNSIVLNLRLREYQNWNIAGLGGQDLSLPVAYYKNALEQLGASENDNIIIVSDDPDLAAKKLSFLKNTRMVYENPQVQFQVLMQAKKLIISNSSFAWWAAYLNSSDAIILAPKYWLGFKVQQEYPVGVIPSKFNTVDF